MTWALDRMPDLAGRVALDLADLDAVTMGAATYAQTFTRLMAGSALQGAQPSFRLWSVSEALQGVILLPAGLAREAANA